MRRKPLERKKSKSYYVYKTTPWIFWKKCCKCGYEVVREPITKISIWWCTKLASKNFGAVIHAGGRENDIYYYCSECCKSALDAENEFIKEYLPLYEK